MDSLHIIMYYIWKYSSNTGWLDMEDIYKMAELIQDGFNNQTEHNYITGYLNNLFNL
jgi:hypothetical protein